MERCWLDGGMGGGRLWEDIGGLEDGGEEN